MTDETSNTLAGLSDALAALVASSGGLVSTVRAGGRARSGIAWRGDLVVTSDQALPEADGYTVRSAEGADVAAILVGRDPGTNVAVLRRTDAGPAPADPTAAQARLGAIALAMGAGDGAEPIARMALIRELGPAWQSMAGGRIDARVRLDMRASRAEEGGPVLDARGALLGMATAGPRGRSLVIPHATIERAVGQILTHGSVRGGWLGVGLQPVAVPPSLREAAEQASGLMVVSLAPSGPAEQAGILPGDIVLALDSEPTMRLRSLRARLGADRVGQPVALRIMRAGAVQEITATVAARPAR